MRTESQKFLDKLTNCKNLSEQKIVSAEFSAYYKNLDEVGKNELKPYFETLKNAINQKIDILDILSQKAEKILSKYQVAEV